MRDKTHSLKVKEKMQQARLWKTSWNKRGDIALLEPESDSLVT